MSLVSLHDLACSRGGLTVLAGVSFEVAAGEAVVLRGPNGSGKTTLLRTVAGLQPPVSGRVDVGDDAIAYAAHADGIKGTLTVADPLYFWAGSYGGGDVTSAMAAFDLEGLAHRRAQALSAGQKRRLGLARLVVTGRPVWVLDEPTVSLDAASVALFADVVGRHLTDGGAALIATHIDLGLAAREIDISAFRPKEVATGSFEEAFL